MIVIPAIDIINGKAVRLYKGSYDKVQIVGENILDIAKEFEAQGAEFIHVVDLDGAKVGSLINKEVVIEIAQKTNVPIEIGGGIRKYEDISFLLKNGVSRVILGTAAIEDKELLKRVSKEFKERIAVGIDCKDGYLYGSGWLKKSKVHYRDFVKEMELMEIQNIIVTDINKDGTLLGSNIELIKDIKKLTDINITASGGIKDINDIKELKKINIYGAITGKAIYNGSLNLKKAIEVCRECR